MRTRLWLGGVLLIIVGFLLGWGFRPAPAIAPTSQPPPIPSASEERPQTASVMLDFGDGTVRVFKDANIAGAKTVFDVMKRLSESGNGFAFTYQPPGQYGTLIEQIGNKKGGDEGKYWLFWVNNALAEVSADNAPVRPGDVIEWKFIDLKSDGGPQP